MLSQRLYYELSIVIESMPRLPLTEKKYYRAMLTLQEQVMRASEDLLQISAATHPYLRRHVEEERGHHRWIVEDLLHLDVIAKEQPQILDVAQMVGMQYYHLICGNPFAFFGYLAFLEGYPAAPATVGAIRAAFPESTRTVEYHARHDVEHRKELVKVLNSLDPKHHDAIVDNAIASAELYRTALWRIIAQEL
jgi:hypothetical protein